MEMILLALASAYRQTGYLLTLSLKVTYLLGLPTWDSCRRLEVPDCLRSVHDKLAVRVAPLYTDFSRLGVSLLQHE